MAIYKEPIEINIKDNSKEIKEKVKEYAEDVLECLKDWEKYVPEIEKINKGELK